LRTYLMWNDVAATGPTIYSPDRHFGARALELRQAYVTLDRILPSTAKLQSSPEELYFDFYSGLYSNRQSVVTGRDCGAGWGGDAAKCPETLASVSAIFDGAPYATWNGVLAVARRLSIDALVVTNLDLAWQDKLSWVWQATPVISGRYVRAYLTTDQEHLALPEKGG